MLSNMIFSSNDEKIAHAQRILQAMEQAQREGRGAVSLDGKFIDIASIKQAEVMVKKAQAIAVRG